MTQAVLNNQVTKLPVSSGIDSQKRERIAEGLKTSLSDHYRLMLNTQILHWNVQGPLFYSVHTLTENQYNAAFEVIDGLAERIRALGMPAPKTLVDLFSTKDFETQSGDRTLETQITDLIGLNEDASRQMRELISVAEDAGDVKTADLLTDRIGELEESAWMLRATIATDS